MAPAHVDAQRQLLPLQLRPHGVECLRLFDLFLILYVAPTIGPLFFPSDIPTLQLAAVHASFAVTLVMRPVGSALFGPYADRHGRKRAMVVAVFGVGVATALLGVLPTIAQAGLLAPILFLALRLVQGVFVGGVVASTHTLSTETVPPHWRGLMSGLIGGGSAGVGALLASLVFYVVSALFPGPAFSVWGWRIVFLTGILGSLLSFFVFRSVEESPFWVELERKRQRGTRPPLKELVSPTYRSVLLLNLLIVAGAGTQYYLTSGYLPTFLNVVNRLPGTAAGPILIAGSLVVIIATALFGALSEAIGRKRTMLATGVVNLFVIPWAYLQLRDLREDALGAIAVYVLVLSFFGNAAYAPVLIFLNERFPTAIRASGTALSWNIGFAIGGIMPTFATGLARQVAALPISIVLFLIGAILIYLLGNAVSPETRGRFV
ncbi:MAG: MFS transporter [Chloroflexi bacterium]|nr:MFS transporter [Chloroflexota bacterium]